jgi:CoA:oxalate CoA-transferase
MTAGGGPLAGIKVVEFTIMIAGPYGGRLLADAGAEVVKVEPPEGDPMRYRTPIREGASTYFGALNVGKQSIVFDLKDPADVRRALELVADADVLLENYRPGVMEKLGLGRDACLAVNPQLVYCSVSGYGQTGPKSTYPAYAPILHALSGYDLTNMSYQRGADVPAATGTFIADIMAGQVAYGAVLTGLMGRSRSGKGDHIDVALMDIMLSTLVYEAQAAQADGPGPGKTVYRPCRAGDEFVIIAAITDRNFRSLVQAMDRSDLLTDPRFATMPAREQNWEEWQDLVADWVEDRDAAELEQYLLGQGVPCSRFRTVAEALEDEQVVARGTLRTGRDSAGTFRYVGAPFQSTSFPADPETRSVPALSAHGTGRAADSTSVAS